MGIVERGLLWRKMTASIRSLDALSQTRKTWWHIPPAQATCRELIPTDCTNVRASEIVRGTHAAGPRYKRVRRPGAEKALSAWRFC